MSDWAYRAGTNGPVVMHRLDNGQYRDAVTVFGSDDRRHEYGPGVDGARALAARIVRLLNADDEGLDLRAPEV